MRNRTGTLGFCLLLLSSAVNAQSLIFGSSFEEELVLQPHNFIFVIDTSGGMAQVIPPEGVTRLEVLQESLAGDGNLFDMITTNTSEFVITIVTFNTAAQMVGEFTDVQDAKDIVNNLVPGGLSNFRNAVSETTDQINIDAFDPTLDDYADFVYFMSEGEPFPEANELTPGDVTAWQDTLSTHDLNSIVVGIALAGGSANEHLEELANPSDTPLVIDLDVDLNNIQALYQFVTIREAQTSNSR